LVLDTSATLNATTAQSTPPHAESDGAGTEICTASCGFPRSNFCHVGPHRAGQQKLSVLHLVVLVHAGTGLAARLIALVRAEMLRDTQRIRILLASPIDCATAVTGRPENDLNRIVEEKSGLGKTIRREKTQ